jgi:hypothetical protein
VSGSEVFFPWPSTNTFARSSNLIGGTQLGASVLINSCYSERGRLDSGGQAPARSE